MEQPSTTPTGDYADAFVRRSQLHARLMAAFRQHRPDDAALAVVSTTAEVAIDQVFAALCLDSEAQQIAHGQVKDYAECSALYGYMVGFLAARQQMEARR